jgi:hydroxylamine reductase
MNMFCYQCQETSLERGCLYFGACGKTEVTANYQDLLIHILRGIGSAWDSNWSDLTGIPSIRGWPAIHAEVRYFCHGNRGIRS